MRRNLCILITGEFPYATSEPFLESEIIYLTRAFERVIIFALDAQPGEPFTREVPDNVTAVPVGYTQGIKKYLKYVLKGLINGRRQYPSHGDNFERYMYSIYERGKAFEAFKFITEYISKDKISMDNCAIYSYWMSDHAFIAALLKERYSSNEADILAVSRAHAFDLYTERNHIGFRPFQEMKLRKLDLVCPCSNDGREYLLRKYPQFAHKIVTERLGTNDYGVTSYDNREWILVTCCNLKKLKRISLFAKAFCIVANKIKDVKWVCIGAGEEFEYIKEIIRTGGADSRVTFLGRKRNTEVLDYYKKNAVSYFCNVSILEGVPVSIMEAMSFGIPIIATDVGGTAEIVSNENGVLIPKDIDAEYLADIILKELSNGIESYMEKRKKSREVWKELSSADVNYTKWSEFLSGEK